MLGISFSIAVLAMTYLWFDMVHISLLDFLYHCFNLSNTYKNVLFGEHGGILVSLKRKYKAYPGMLYRNVQCLSYSLFARIVAVRQVIICSVKGKLP